MKEVYRLVRPHEEEQHQRAMKMLSQNETVLDACMLPLKEWMDLGMNEFWNQDRNTGRTR